MATENDEEKKYYSRLLRSSAKKMGFVVVFLPVFFLLSLIIAQNSILNKGWSNLILPIIIFNIPIIIYPLIDEWEYKPWQSKTQKYERHYDD